MFVGWTGVRKGDLVLWHTTHNRIKGRVTGVDVRQSVNVITLDTGEEIRLWRKGPGSRIEVLERSP